MTVSVLLALIAGALLAQAAVALGIAIWKRGAALPGVAATGGAIPAATVGAWSGWREFRVERRAFEDRASTQCSFYLVPCDGVPLPPFKPGQYLTFQLRVPYPGPHTGPDQQTITRCYSLSDQPSPDRYRITVKKALPPVDKPEWLPGIASSHFHTRVMAGSTLQVRAPAGHFQLEPDTSVPAVLIGGGIGMTPLLSMLT
jgi:ferredoxin-NADP reductase